MPCIIVDNLRPFAEARFNQPGQLFTGDTVTFDGGNSYDPDGGSLTFQWTFIDRPEGSNALLENADTFAPSFTIDKQGDYIVQLIVNDGQADSEPATVFVEGAETCIQNLAIRPKYNLIQLTWTYNPDTELVEIERSLNLNGPYEVIAETDATYLDLGLINGTTYYYRLRGKFAVSNVVECYQIPDSPVTCGEQQCSWIGPGLYDCGGQQCEIISYEPLIAECSGSAGGGTNSCPPEDSYCQWMCEGGYGGYGGEGFDHDKQELFMQSNVR